MKKLEDIDKVVLRDHLVKCWMTHDAMWFYSCLEQHGIEETNRLNINAVRSMATIEIHRIMKLLGIPKGSIYTFEDVKELIDGAMEIAKADFMQFSYSFPKKNVLQWEIEQCFAHDGVAQLGAIGGYQCGILERIKSWLEGVGINYTMEPEVKGCLMHSHGYCRGQFRTDLP